MGTKINESSVQIMENVVKFIMNIAEEQTVILAWIRKTGSETSTICFFFFFNETQLVEKMYEEICVSQVHLSVCGINFAHFVLILSPARDLCWT